MKKSARILPLVGLLVSFSLVAYDYVYPVGVCQQLDGTSSVLVMYQKSPQHTELWLFDPESGAMQRALLSIFTPLGVALLPNNAGFSFFDNGRLRVKLFQKRSSKAIDIFEPLYDLGPVHWETEQVCYFHARERDHFNIYRLDASDGSVEKIVSKETCDCFYPCIRDGELWYVQRSAEASSVIASKKEGEVVVYTQGRPLAFLTPLDDTAWLIIEHPGDIDLGKDKLFTCTCCRLHEGNLQRLFTFSIPLHYIAPTSEMRLCESIYPLLPRVVENTIYFVSQSERGTLQAYSYNEKGVHECVVPKENLFSDLFAPLPLKSSLVYGGLLKNEWNQEL